MMHEKFNDFPEVVQKNLSDLDEKGIPYQIKVFEKPGSRASQAADLLGCELGAIVKSLVFLMDGKELLLVLVSGENWVDMNRLEAFVEKKISQAKPAYVKRLTGYEVGSVAPFGIPGDFPVIIDEDLLTHEFVWAAAGSAHILIRFTPTTLQQVSGGKVFAIKET